MPVYYCRIIAFVAGIATVDVHGLLQPSSLIPGLSVLSYMVIRKESWRGPGDDDTLGTQTFKFLSLK